MAGFTKKTTQPTVLNKEGATAWQMTPKLELVTRVATSFNEPKFYETSEDELITSIRAVLKTDPEFVLKLAVYARQELYLRSVPIILLVEYANEAAGSVRNARRYVPAIIRRADEVAQTIAAQFARNLKHPRKSKLPNFLRHGLKLALEQFDPYQLAKYRGEGDSVTLRDAMFLLHPRPRDEIVRQAYDLLAKDELRIEEGATWERTISAKGSSPEAWTEAAKVMPYMALLRNLRNLAQHGVELREITPRLMDPEQIRRSKQMPFRFLSAYKEIEKAEVHPNTKALLLGALSQAMRHSLSNLPDLPGTTAVLVDTSGSMCGKVSSKSTTTYADIACLFGAALAAKGSAFVMAFAERVADVPLNPDDSLITNSLRIARTNVGMATYAYKAIDRLIEQNRKVDRIVILTDEQCYDSTRWGWDGPHRSVKDGFEAYRREVNPKAQLFVFDLAGYGTAMFPMRTPYVFTFAGWSDRALRLMNENIGDITAAVEAVQPPSMDLLTPRGEGA